MNSGTYQHFVPRFILRGFAHGKRGKERLWVHDKSTSKEFESKISVIAGDSGFYDLPSDGQGVSLDPLITELEGVVAPIFQRVIREESLPSLGSGDRELLALFIAAQGVRTHAFRSTIKRLNVEMAEHIKALGYDPREVHGFKVLSEEDVKIVSMGAIGDLYLEVEALLRLSWFLFRVPSGSHLYTSDNPVVRQNIAHRDRMDSLGLISRGIEVYLPLSDKLVLAMLCPSLSATIESNAYLMGVGRSNSGVSIPSHLEIERIRTLIKSGKPLPLTLDQVKNLNSLQAYHARRFVFCMNQRFDLVHEMASKEKNMNLALRSEAEHASLVSSLGSAIQRSGGGRLPANPKRPRDGRGKPRRGF